MVLYFAVLFFGCITLIIYTVGCVVGSWRIPGPWYTSFTGMVLLYHELMGDRTRWIHQLHARYGSVVRIAPNNIHFNMVEAVQLIYGNTPCIQKDLLYNSYKHLGHDNLFSSLSTIEGAHRRRNLHGIFTKSTLTRQPYSGILLQNVQRLVSKIRWYCLEEKAFRLHDVFACFSIDVVTSMVYSPQCSSELLTLESSDHSHGVVSHSKDTRYWRRLLHRSGHQWLGWMLLTCQNAVSVYRKSLQRLGSHQNVQGLPDRLSEYLRDVEQRRMNWLCEPSSDDLFGRLIASGLSRAEVTSETRAIVFAGSATIPPVMTMLVAHLVNSPVTLQALVSELVDANLRIDPEMQHTLDKLPVLHAICMEGLRIFAPIPMTLPRTTMVDMSILGHHIPKSTKIGCQAYSIHRLPGTRELPDCFDHTFWLKRDKSPRMTPAELWAFSSGPRSCPGQYLALLEMKWALAALLLEFNFSLVSPDYDESSWSEDVTSFTLQPPRASQFVVARRVSTAAAAASQLP